MYINYGCPKWPLLGYCYCWSVNDLANVCKCTLSASLWFTCIQNDLLPDVHVICRTHFGHLGTSIVVSFVHYSYLPTWMVSICLLNEYMLLKPGSIWLRCRILVILSEEAVPERCTTTRKKLHDFFYLQESLISYRKNELYLEVTGIEIYMFFDQDSNKNNQLNIFLGCHRWACFGCQKKIPVFSISSEFQLCKSWFIMFCWYISVNNDFVTFCGTERKKCLSFVFTIYFLCILEVCFVDVLYCQCGLVSLSVFIGLDTINVS